MGKAVLVMDLPESCDKCYLARFVDSEEERVMCSIDRMTSMAVEDAIEKKPDWCPLRKLPEKKQLSNCKNFTDLGWVNGWNACLDVIEGVKSYEQRNYSNR